MMVSLLSHICVTRPQWISRKVRKKRVRKFYTLKLIRNVNFIIKSVQIKVLLTNKWDSLIQTNFSQLKLRTFSHFLVAVYHRTPPCISSMLTTKSRQSVSPCTNLNVWQTDTKSFEHWKETPSIVVLGTLSLTIFRAQRKVHGISLCFIGIGTLWSQQNFAHATRAVLSWHVQNL